jgi:hypothetical protein
MGTLIFSAGVLVSSLFVIGYSLYKKESSAQRQRAKRKKSTNEYRTNEEYISYPAD